MPVPRLPFPLGRARSAWPWLALFALTLLNGCGRESPRAVYSVEGRLFVGDLPASNAALAFHPVGTGAGRVRPVAMTGPDGAYRLTTYSRGDGAPAGDYVITVIWPDPSIPFDECEGHDPSIHDRLRGFYADRATSQLRATVRPQANNEITLWADDVNRLLEQLSKSQ